MLQSLPKSEATESTVSESGRLGWLKKWFGGDEAQESGPQKPAGASYPPVMAYQPPQAASADTGANPTPAGNDTFHGFANRQAMTAVAKPPVVERMPTLPVSPAPVPPATNDAVTKAKQLREEGHALDRSGDLIAAEQVYRQAIGANPTSAASVNDLGLCLARQGKFMESAAVLRQAIVMRSDKPLYRNNLATVLVELGQTDEALAHLKTASSPAAAHYNLGQLLARTGKIDEAIAQQQQAIEVDPTFTPAREALTRLAPEQPAESTEQPTFAATTTPGEASSTPNEPTRAQQRTMQVAQRSASTPTSTDEAASTGVPSFPRLLPPVLD